MLPLIEVCQALRTGRNGSHIPTRMISTIKDEAHEVETFLDDYDARSNRTFATITEFVACARGFADITRTIQHLISRFSSYHAPRDPAFDGAFLDDAGRTLAFAQASLRKLLGAVVDEVATVMASAVPRRRRAKTDPPERLRHATLPHDIVDLAPMNERDKIAELGALYLAHKHTLDKFSPCKRIDGVAAMRRYVLEVSDEEQCRFFQTRMHNLQSKYDTFIKATEAEKKDPDLKRFRGSVSITFHLIEGMTQLVHFYERHENDIREEQVKNRIAALIDKDEVLDRALNFCLFFAHSYLNEGSRLAEELVVRYTSQERIVLSLPEGIHIHIRPASLIAEIVKHHATPVKITIGNDTRYAGSALDVLMAAGTNSGERKITFEGDRRPLEDLRQLFEHRLGEDGLARFPQQIAYLRRSQRPTRPTS